MSDLDFAPVAAREPAAHIAGQVELFAPEPDIVVINASTPKRELRAHPITLTPSSRATWVAAIDRTKVAVSASTPHAALAHLLGDADLDRGIIGDAPHACQSCRKANALIGHSPRGKATVVWYCGAPCQPHRKTKKR